MLNKRVYLKETQMNRLRPARGKSVPNENRQLFQGTFRLIQPGFLLENLDENKPC